MSDSLTELIQNKHTNALDKTKDLLKLYHEQKPLHQAIMQIRALSFYTRRKTDFLQCIAQSDLLTPDYKKLTPYQLSPILNHLVSTGLLTNDCNCCMELIYPLSVIALDPSNPRAQANLSALENLPLEHDEDYLRETHLALHRNNIDFFINKTNANIEDYNTLIYTLSLILYTPLLAIDWFKTRHPLIQLLVCIVKMQILHVTFKMPPPDFVQWAKFFIHSMQNNSFLATVENIPLLQTRLLQFTCIMGQLGIINNYANQIPANVYFQQENQGTLAFFAGDHDKAIIHYEKASKLFKPLFHTDSWIVGNTHGVLYTLLLIQQGQFEKTNKIIAKLRRFKVFSVLPNILETLLFFKQGNTIEATENHLMTSHQLIDYP